MYTLVSAYGVSTGINGLWGAADIAALPFNVVFNTYRRLYLTLETVFLADPIHVDFEIFRAEYSNATDTVADVLAALDNTTLETVPSVPAFETKKIRFADAFHAGYRVEAAATGSAPSAGTAPHLRDEIRMYRTETDMKHFYENCMVTVNGFFHLLDTDEQYVYVMNGGKSKISSNQNQMGIWNFEDIGKLEYLPLKEDMIFKQHQDSFRSRKIYFDLGDTDTAGKTLLLILGGYLYMPAPGIFYPTGQNTWAVNLTNIPIIERYFESRKYIDLSSLPFTPTPTTHDLINVTEFFSDEVITKYCTLSQSFFVLVDTPRIYQNRHYLKKNHLPGIYTAYFDPKLPLITGYGRASEYWKRYEAGHWDIHVADSDRTNLVFNSISDKVPMASGARMPFKPFVQSRGYFLELGADKQV